MNGTDDRRRRVAAFIAVALALTAFAGPAQGHRGGHHHHHGKVVVHTTISIKFQGGGSDPYAQEPNFSGRVQVKSRRSKGHRISDDVKRKCVSHSRVKIYRKRGPKLASTRTDGKGRYAVRAGRHFVPGKRYLATVETKSFKHGKKKVVCKGSTSRAIVARVR